MYDLMIEEYDQRREELREQRKAILRSGSLGTPLAVCNAKIDMCSEFIAFLRRVEQQDIALQAESRITENE